jgi:hypothetical protein
MDLVEDCLDVIKSGADSLYSRADLRDILGKLPAGLYVYGTYVDSSQSTVKATGQSVAKKTSDTVRITNILLFKDETAAASARSQYQNAIAGGQFSEYDNPEVTLNGNCVTIVGDSPTHDFEWPLG